MYHLRNKLRIFLCCRQNMFLFQDIHIFNHPMIYLICDVMMSISTRDRVYFWIDLFNHNSSSHQTGQLIDISEGNNFQKSFEQFGGLGLSFPFYLATSSNCSINSYVKIPLFHFLKRWIKDNKNGKSQLWKMAGSCCLVVLIKS